MAEQHRERATKQYQRGIICKHELEAIIASEDGTTKPCPTFEECMKEEWEIANKINKGV